jgi:hypothetical protein
MSFSPFSAYFFKRYDDLKRNTNFFFLYISHDVVTNSFQIFVIIFFMYIQITSLILVDFHSLNKVFPVKIFAIYGNPFFHVKTFLQFSLTRNYEKYFQIIKLINYFSFWANACKIFKVSFRVSDSVF